MRIVTTLAAVLVATVILKSADTLPLRQVETIPLPDVQGRIDHLSVDVPGRRLFVSALGNNTIEVLDLRAGRWLARISGLEEPQGVFYLPALNKIFVASGKDGTCKIFGGSSFKLLGQVKYPDDADNIRYDAGHNLIYVGYGAGALGALDAATGQKMFDIPLAGHPESFRLEGSGPRIFVNVPAASHSIAVVDREKRSVIATWTVDAQANFPMILDEADHRLLIVTRQPARLVAMDTRSGKTVASYPAVGDADDAFYDNARRRVYISGGAGFLDVFSRDDPDHYQKIAEIPTASGARTSLFVPELNRLYLAVPHRGNQPAEIRVFEVQP